MTSIAQRVLAQIPKTVDITHLKIFLLSQELGICEVFTQKTSGFRFRRSMKEPGAYYRDPYPLTVCVFVSDIPDLPIVEAALELHDMQELLAYTRITCV